MKTTDKIEQKISILKNQISQLQEYKRKFQYLESVADKNGGWTENQESNASKLDSEIYQKFGFRVL